jgi:hypothetical protein
MTKTEVNIRLNRLPVLVNDQLKIGHSLQT